MADRLSARQDADISARNILLNKAVKLGKRQVEAQTATTSHRVVGAVS